MSSTHSKIKPKKKLTARQRKQLKKMRKWNRQMQKNQDSAATTTGNGNDLFLKQVIGDFPALSNELLNISISGELLCKIIEATFNWGLGQSPQRKFYRNSALQSPFWFTFYVICWVKIHHTCNCLYRY